MDRRLPKPSRLRGFTVLELLVVLTIIGILSSIVISSVNNARSRAKNNATKATFGQIQKQAEIIYTSAGSYAGLCIDGVVDVGLNQVWVYSGGAAGGARFCMDGGNPLCQPGRCYVMAGKLSKPEGSVTHWCADSKGYNRGISNARYLMVRTGSRFCE